MSAARARLLRYAGAAIGPICVAGAQFLLSLLLLRSLNVSDFGRFAFLLVVSQLLVSLWSALFTAPLLVAAAGDAGAVDTDVGNSGAGKTGAGAAIALARVSIFALVPASLAMAAIALLLGTSGPCALIFGLWGAMALLRHFARAWHLVKGAPARTMASDLAYGLALSSGGLLLARSGGQTLIAAAALLLAAAPVGLVPFLKSRIVRARETPVRGSLRAYGAIWRRDARWSLLGVLTTEATVNSQSYIVTALGGAGAFAPIAATALLVRPVTVAINALTEFERARLARDIQAGAIDAARAARRHLRLALLAVWAATLVLATGLLWLAPDLVFHGKFTSSTLWTGAALWFAVVLARAAHAPDGAVLLASGRFRALALLSSMTACVSLGATTLLLLLAGPLWSIGGIALGEGCFAWLLWRSARAELARRAALIGAQASARIAGIDPGQDECEEP